MIQSFFIYTLFAFLLFGLGNLSFEKDKLTIKATGKQSFLTPPVWMILFVFSFFSAVRWRVGKDHPEYYEAYENVKRGLGFRYLGNTREDIEIGFKFLTDFIASFDFHFTIFFGTIAFIQILFFLKAFSDRKYLYPFLLIVIVLGPAYLTWMNGMRQMIVACMFVYATKFIIDRKFYKYLIFVLIASLIHKSAPLLLVFYFFANNDMFKNSFLTCLILVASIIIGNSPVWMNLFSSLDELLSVLGYTKYSETIDEMVKVRNIMNFGPRQIVIITPVVLLIFYKDKLVDFFKDRLFLVSYNLTVLGYCLHSIFANTSAIFLRPIFYLSIFSVISSSYLLFYLKKTLSKKNYVIYVIALLSCLSYTMISAIADSKNGQSDFSTFKFFWDYTYKF